MLIDIDPREITIEAERTDTGLNVLAAWRHERDAGVARCLWEDDEKTRLFIADLMVSGEKQVEPKRVFRRVRRANFRGHGIGKRLLREVIEQAPLIGARELFGKVVELDLVPSPFLLEWYEREGFEILKPFESDKPQVKARIVMRFE